MMFLGIGFLVVVCGLALFLKNPPQDPIPPNPASFNKTQKPIRDGEFTPFQMMKTKKFYLKSFLEGPGEPFARKWFPQL